MRKKSYAAAGIGAPSLLLILVVLSLSILAALTLMSARGDEKLSRRSADVTGSVYTLYAETEETLASLDAITRACRGEAASEEAFWEILGGKLPDSIAFFENMLYIKCTDGTREVTLAVRPNYTGSERLTVVSRSLSAVAEEAWN